jgi:beta-lactamase class D
MVKQIMIAKDTLGYVLREKTGWGAQGNTDIGWHVGYVETNGNVYYFANCIQCANPNNRDFGNARTEITYVILKELKIIKE